MAPTEWSELKALFAEASDLPAEERTALLDRRCPPGSPLRAELEGLLHHHDTAGAFLEEPVRELAARLVSSGLAGLPERIGPFRIVREIGRGGMGTVYQGERDEGGFEQHVAIKVVRRGMDTEDVQRRFLAERRILARLDHPNIARLVDGGVTSDGRPYFVMEYIEGAPLAEYLGRHTLGLRDRLLLFQSICRAVAYAHQNLVLHRDLKPSNILITREGQPKLLDFGVAKVLGSEDRPDTRTHPGGRYLTPAFASPEQIRGEPLTTASDVYALGLLLFELLTGERPFATDRAASGDEGNPNHRAPPRPSATASARRREAPVAPHQLRGDLDVIVATALHPEPTRRYESAHHLLADMERYLAGLPILAHRDSIRYRAGKFVRRHRWGVGAATAAALGLVAALGVFVAQSIRIAGERDKAQRVTALLVELLQGSDPAEALGDTLTARALLDRSAARIESELASQPEVQATLLDVVGGLYHSLGLPEQAEPPLRTAVAIRRAVLGPEHAEVAQSLNALGGVLDASGRFDEAERVFEEALDIRRARFRAPHAAIAESLNDLGQLLLFARQDFARAEPLLQEAVGMRRRLFDPPHRDLAESVHNLALLEHLRGRYPEAAELYRESLGMRRALFGETHPALVATLNNLALVLQAQGRYHEAEPLLRESLALREELLGPTNPQVALAMANLGLSLRELGELEEAGALLRRALGVAAAGFGERHPRTATVMSNLADVLREGNELDEAETLYRHSLAIRREALGADHPHVAFSLNGLAEVARMRDRPGQSDSLHREALALRRARLGPDHPDVAQSLVGLARAEQALDAWDDSEANLREALRIRKKTLGERHPATAEVEVELAGLLMRAGRTAEARALAAKAVLTLRETLSDDDPRTRRARALEALSG